MTRKSLIGCGLGFSLVAAAFAIYLAVAFWQESDGIAITLSLCATAVNIANLTLLLLCEINTARKLPPTLQKNRE